MITSWAQPHSVVRLLHRFKSVVRFFWLMVSWLLKFKILHNARQKSMCDDRVRMVESTFPDEPIFIDRPCIVPYNAHAYYDHILSGAVTPKQGEFVGFYENGIELRGGERIESEVVVLSLGIQTPDFHFLPVKFRYLLEKEGGVQLYRHVLHPRIPRMAFIGHNQSFLFMPSVEVSALWMVALWKGELQLPSVEVCLVCIHGYITTSFDIVSFSLNLCVCGSV
jgi:dimethylaniline monooxygenase (N-oxide forming)